MSTRYLRKGYPNQRPKPRRKDPLAELKRLQDKERREQKIIERLKATVLNITQN